MIQLSAHQKIHRLNGLVANFGGERFLEVGINIENSTRNGVINPGTVGFDILAAELEQLKRILSETNWGALCTIRTD